jgi:hypothetical protein
MDHQEPPRWSDHDDVGELLAGVSEARAAGPSAEQLARMRTALALPAAAAKPAGAGKSRWLSKVLIGVLLLGGASFVAQRARPRKDEARPAPSSTIAAPQPEPPRELLAVPPSAPVAEPVPVLEVERVVKPRSARTRAATPAPAQEPLSDVNAELVLLRPARAHVRSAPQRALALVAEHERKYPRGVLVEEREVIAIEALLVAHEDRAAEQRARRFFGEHPRSAHARRIRSLFTTAGNRAFDQE